MKKTAGRFALKLTLFLAMITGIILFVIMPQYKYGYNACLADKLHNLEKTESPRVILAGNSNLSFGVRSDLLEEELGMPVMNMGFYGGLGEAFQYRMLRDYIREGDIVVIAPDGFGDTKTVVSDGAVCWTVLENNFELWKLPMAGDWVELVKTFPIYLRKVGWLWLTGAGNQPQDPPYSRDCVNEYGDVDYPMPDCQITAEDLEPFGYDLDENYIGVVNDFNDFLKSKGATLLVSTAPLCELRVDDTEKLQEIWDGAEAAIEAPMISDWQDYFYPLEAFSNTYLHLTDSYKIIRTQQLAADIKAALEIEK